jgi:transcriptional regulator with XRE-family HTH domain
MSSSSVVMEALHKCDTAHRQGVMLPDFLLTSRGCDIALMSEEVARGFDMGILRTQLDRLMKAHDIKRKPLAKKAGLGETAIRDIFDDGRNDVRGSTLIKLAEFFDVTVDELTGGPVVVGGKIGAGGSVLFEEDVEPREVERPPLTPGRIMALEVVGDSMFPRYDPGSIIYIRRDHEGVLPQYLGRECAIALADGGTFLKILEEGTVEGKYNLRSHNAPLMRNVEVLWASPVLFVRPPQPPQLQE